MHYVENKIITEKSTTSMNAFLNMMCIIHSMAVFFTLIGFAMILAIPATCV